MPRTKKKPNVTPEPAVNGAVVGDVLTLAEAAAHLRLPEGDILAAVDAQGLPGQQVNGEWRFSQAGIQRWLSASQSTVKARNAAILALAGKYKDDPDLVQIVEDAMRRRGRPLMDDGTYSGVGRP